MRSIDLAATLLLDNFRKEVDKGNLVGVVFMDLPKAFDTNAHSTLLGKLTTYGINNKELDLFTSYLFNCTQQVVLDNVKSEIQHVHCCVPQGSISSPLLFLVFFNDFPDVLLRADIIYFSSNNFHVIENVLNKDWRTLQITFMIMI